MTSEMDHTFQKQIKVRVLNYLQEMNDRVISVSKPCHRGSQMSFIYLYILIATDVFCFSFKYILIYDFHILKYTLC